jgi:hypothetical protein
MQSKCGGKGLKIKGRIRAGVLLLGPAQRKNAGAGFAEKMLAKGSKQRCCARVCSKAVCERIRESILGQDS